MAQRPRGRALRRGSSLHRARRWTANLHEANLTVATQVNVSIVESADYEQSTTLQAKGVTLARIRGNISIGIDTVAADGAVIWAITVSDEDEGAPDITSAQSMLEEDVLLWGALALSTAAAGSTMVSPIQIPVDVKAMRKLKNHEVRYNVIATGAGNVIRSVAVFRALLVGG